MSRPPGWTSRPRCWATGLGVRTIKRLALMAAARFEPDTLTDPDERRWVRIAADRDGAGGAGWVDGRLDTPDALDLEAALQRIAADLAQAGAQDDLDVRRAQALGVMARRALGQPELPAEAAAESTEPPTDADRSPGSASPGGRPVMLYVHVDAAQLVTGRGLAEVATTGQLVTIDHLRRWCGDAGTITVRPVIDLTTDRTGRGYEPTDTMREHLALRDRTCVFPHCARTAHPIRQRRSRNVSHDADHIVPYVSGGETSTDNLACLCRSHHLLRTHTDWHYTMIGPGEYLWTSPTGHQFLRTNNGTSMLTGLHSRDRPRKAS